MRAYLLLALTSLVSAASAQAAPLTSSAEAVARRLVAACPVVAYDDEAAFESCSRKLHTLKLPFEPVIDWGGDQPDKILKKRNLTHFNSQVFQTMYLPLYSFTGRWSLTQDAETHVPVLRLEAYFRNHLPTGDYPYPFWHSSDKWQAYESSNEVRLYLDPKGLAFVVTRDAAGDEQPRGVYTHVQPPAFDGAWQWHDATGMTQPHVSLFSNRYSHDNPHLADVDKAYRTFALQVRDESCLDCHTPANKASATRLTLLQTPLHAAGAIDDVIKAVKSGEMPEDDIGLRKDIPPEERAALLTAATAFRNELTRADKWEASRRP